jgi:hypothetical protein
MVKMSTNRTIADVQADIAAVKKKIAKIETDKPNWSNNSEDKALIIAYTNLFTSLSQELQAHAQTGRAFQSILLTFTYIIIIFFVHKLEEAGDFLSFYASTILEHIVSLWRFSCSTRCYQNIVYGQEPRFPLSESPSSTSSTDSIRSSEKSPPPLPLLNPVRRRRHRTTT